jgi:hypothetical protein
MTQRLGASIGRGHLVRKAAHSSSYVLAETNEVKMFGRLGRSPPGMPSSEGSNINEFI